MTIYGFDDLPPQLLTFPVFVAPKGASRVVQRAEQLFQEEMRLLKKTGHFTIFDGRCHVRGTVPVCVHSVAALQDQPMRRGSNHLMLGTSNLHVRFGYSGHVKALQRFLPACRTCIRKRRQPTVASDEGRAHGDDQCSNCLSWRFPEVDEMLNRFPPPPDYPSDAEDLYTVSNSEQVFILPKKITHELLVARTRTARTNLESGHWDIKSASAYLARLGVTDSTISDLLLPAHRRRMLAFYTAREGSRLTPSQARTVASIQLALQEHPESFEDVPDPPAWKGVHTLWQFIDVIMHLLFLGIIKHLVFDMHEGFKMASSLPAFIERTARRLKSIPSLSWLVKEDYHSAGLSGWVSENFVALARLFPWIFQDCGDCIAKEAGSARGERQATALLGNPTNWTKDQLLTWLHTRAIDIQAFADMPDISGECSKVQEHCRAYSLLRVPMVELKKSQLVAMVQHIQRIPPIRGDEEEWTMDSCRGWLLQHGYNLTRLARAVHQAQPSTNRALSEQIRKMDESGGTIGDMDHPDFRKVIVVLRNLGQRQTRPNPPLGVMATLLPQLIQAAHHLVVQVMCHGTHEGPTPSTIDHSVQDFLDLYAKYDALLKATKAAAQPSWVSSYNFLCLLNLPEMAKNYGPLRMFWEGGLQGEAFIKFIKAEVRQGFRTRWHVNGVQRFLQRSTIKLLCDAIKPPDETNYESVSYFQGRVHLYKDVAEVQPLLDSGLPLSVCADPATGDVVVVWRGALGVRLERQVEVSTKLGLTYFSWKPVDYTEQVDAGVFGSLRPALLLPLMEKDSGHNRVFAVIDNEWHQSTPQGMALPNPVSTEDMLRVLGEQ